MPQSRVTESLSRHAPRFAGHDDDGLIERYLTRFPATTIRLLLADRQSIGTDRPKFPEQ